MAGAGLRSRRGLVSIVLATGAGSVVVIAAAWYLLLRDVAEPTTVSEAVTSFREETGETPGGPSAVPEGVYVYATDGFERTDALTGVTHRYPRSSTITVTRDPCGVRMRWDVLKGRSTVWTYCVGAAGWTVEIQDERHTFFGRTEHTTYTCADTPYRPAGDKAGYRPAGDKAGSRFRVSCDTPTVRERGDGLVVGRETLRVGGRVVQTVHLRRTTSFTGGTTGMTTNDAWLGQTSGVPVRLVMVSNTTNDSPVGDVHYEEDVTLELRSLAPQK